MPDQGFNRVYILRIWEIDHEERTTQMDATLFAGDDLQPILTPEIPKRLTAKEPLSHCARLELFEEPELSHDPGCTLADPRENGFEWLSCRSLNLYRHVWLDCDLKAVMLSVDENE